MTAMRRVVFAVPPLGTPRYGYRYLQGLHVGNTVILVEERVLEIELPRDRTAPRLARQRVRERFEHELSDDQFGTVLLLVSELVTNAVLHGQGTITMRTSLNHDRLLVEVIDEGPGPEAAVRELDFENPPSGGRGLLIVDAASSRWGVRKHTGHVWFEVERPGPRTDISDAAYL